jgi:predicted phage terminase large subunit-like protein
MPEITCLACGMPKERRFFPAKNTNICSLCVATNKTPLEIPPDPTQAPKLSDIVADIQLSKQINAYSDDGTEIFPQVEIDYKHPSAQELAARILAKRRLLYFIMRFKANYKPGWVHKDICRRLERFMQDVADGKSPRLLMMLPPRTGKSEIGSKNFVPFALGHHPDWEIIAASHTGGLTMSFSRYIRDLLRDPSYHALFPNATLDPKSQSVENWNLLQGGGYLAAGVGTGITGRGAHILLLDDLVKDIEAADSQGQRDSTWEWYISTAYTRLAPGGGVLGIMTWWNEDDWAGRIQQVMAAGDGDQFEIIKYPAINDLGDEYLLPDDSIVQLPPGSTIPAGAQLTRPMGTAVHPERYSTEAMTRIKRNLEAAGQKRIWASLYQQNPTPDEGIFFTKRMFREYAHTPSRLNVRIYQAWDFAITTNQTSDWTVGCTILHDEYDNLYVLDVYRFRSDDGEEIVNYIVQYAQDWGVDVVGFEDTQIWKSIAASFTRVCREKKYYPSYELLKPFTDKQVRAQPLRGRMQAGRVWFPVAAPWYPETQQELLRFPAGKHDDIVDSLAWCVRLIMSKSAPHGKKPVVLKSWKDKLKKHIAGSGGGHMSA